MNAQPAAAAQPPLPALLIVEDEPLVLREMARGLGHLGYVVVTAGSAVEADARLAECDDVGVVVSDIRMAGEDGLSLARRLLQGRGALDALEVVLITGHATVEDAAAAVRTGAFDFLQKPFRLTDLAQAVRRAMQRVQQRRADAAALAQRQRAVNDDTPRDVLDGAGLQQLLRAGTGGAGLALIRCDLLQMQVVADAFGPAATTTLQRCLLDRLHDAALPGEHVALLGMQSCAVLCPDIAAPDLAARLAALQALLSAPVALADGSVVPDIALAAAHAGAVGPRCLQAAAEAALAAARAGGGIEVFDASRHASLLRRADLKPFLRAAISQGDLGLWYQPLQAVPDGRLLGFEALLRLVHPVHGVIPAPEVLALAEDMGVVQDLDIAVLETALRDLPRFAAGEVEVLHVNISAASLARRKLQDVVQQALLRHGIAPTRLCLEITERHVLEDSALPVLQALRRQGVRIALDDFGHGFSSLARLRDLPADVLKLDAGFLRPAATPGEEDQGQDFLAHVVALAHSLRLHVVAEGVETPAQWDVARRAGCDAVQGFLVAPPLPLEDARAWLRQAPRRALHTEG